MRAPWSRSKVSGDAADCLDYICNPQRGYRLVTRSYDSPSCLNSKLNDQCFLRGPRLFATLLAGFNLFFNMDSSTSSVRFQTKMGDILWSLCQNHVCESNKYLNWLSLTMCLTIPTPYRSPERATTWLHTRS